jgi:uncharacterized coiled-coil protein SlyX
MENNDSQITELNERIGKNWDEIVKMETRLSEITPKLETIGQSIQTIETKISEATNQFVSINTHFTDYFTKSDATLKSKFEIVNENISVIESFQKTSIEIKKDLEDFKEFVYGNAKTEKIGFKKEIEMLFETNKSANESLIKTWNESYQVLFLKIEGLLPGATATGLSKAYQDQKKNYKSPLLIWSIIFSLTAIGMMIFGIHVYSNTSSKDFSETLQHILTRLPFFIPAVWLAIFASKQQSQYKRLQEEYIYKETLAKSYEAYKREIDSLPEGTEKSDLQKRLISSMVEMCGYNPSMTLENKSHDDKPPIIGSRIVDKVLNTTSKSNSTE